MTTGVLTNEEALQRLGGIGDKIEKLSGMPEDIAKIRAEQDQLKRDVNEMQAAIRSKKISLPGSECEKDFSLQNIGRALLEAARTGRHPKEYAPKEWDISEEARKINPDYNERSQAMHEGTRTTMVSNTPSIGGFLVPSQLLVDKLYPLLYANMVLKDLGATMMTDIAGEPFEVPKFTGGTTAYWVGEEKALTESNATGGTVKFSCKEIGVLVAISKRLKRFNPMVERGLMDDIAMQIALGIEQAALIGKGSEFQPQGIIKGAGGAGTTYPWLEGAIDSTICGTDVDLGATGGAMTFVQALKFIGGLQDNNALKGNLGFVLNPKAFRIWQNDTTNQYTVPTPIAPAKIEELVGYKVRTTTSLPATLAKTTTTLSPVIFGNWTDLWVPIFQGAEVTTSDVAYNPTTAKSGLVHRLTHVAVHQCVDVGVMRSASFAASNEATTV